MSDTGGQRSTAEKLLIGAAVAGGAFALGTVGAAWLATHPARLPLWRTPGDEGWPFEDVDFRSRDGLRLSGWLVPHPEARGTVVFCHGHWFNRAQMLAWARMVYGEAANMLLFDFRAAGKSEGSLCTIGHQEVEDLLGAVDYLSARPDTANLPIAVVGLSMGGAAALMAAAQDERIAALVTHGAFATLQSAIEQRYRMFLGPLQGALSKPAVRLGKRWLPAEPCDVAPVAVIGRIAPRPLLLFHGARDFIIPPADGRALYEAASAPRILHRLPSSWHMVIHRRDQAEYERLLRGFLRQYLL